MDKQKYILIILRVVAIAIVLLMIINPHVRFAQRHQERSLVAVAVDTSNSMSISDPVKRTVVAEEILNSQGIEKLTSKFRIKKFQFNKGISGKNPDTTNISRTLSEIKRELAGEQIQALLLLSDGRQTGGADAVGEAERFGAPVYTVGIGNPAGLRDLAVRDILSPEIAFRRTEFGIDTVIAQYGFDGRNVTVNLKEGKEIIATRRVRLDESEKTVSFQVKTEKLGRHEYLVEIPVYKGERVSRNNTKRVFVEVIREKTRIMYICGQPGWEYSFLRAHLKTDPNIELVSFVILRNPHNIAIVPDNQLSLIPFPAHDIFAKDLYGFDLMILENFSYRRFFGASLLQSIKKFVMEKGGGFLMIGGPDAFGRGGYKGTGVEDVLPVEIASSEKIINGKFRMRVVASQHPIMQLERRSAETETIWAGMPMLDSINAVVRPRPGAVVLGVHPFEKNEHGNLPVIVVWQCGKGRAMAVTSDSTWRWRFLAQEEGAGYLYYDKFWRSAVRWLVQAPEWKQVQVSVERGEVNAGDKVDIKILVRDKYGRGVARLPILTLEGPDAKRVNLGKPVEVAGTVGEYWASVLAPQDREGKYKVVARASTGDGAGAVLEGAAEFEVRTPQAEWLNPSLNEPLLKEIARVSGGTYWRAADFTWQDFSRAIAAAPPPSLATKRPLWHQWPFLIGLVGVLGTEWWLRRRSGLL